MSKIKIYRSLIPLSWLYGLVIYIRNKLFDWNILPQQEFDIPVICIGNLSVGGTGKTPHTEFLIRLLSSKYRIAVLSRGYKRKTKGFFLSDSKSTVKEIGDEPFQIKHKFPNIVVAVDLDRRRGIKYLLSLPNKPEVILLDDAFQHRYVKPSLNIILANYDRLLCDDMLLPAGRLREPLSSLNRANVVIITKSPETLKSIEYSINYHKLKIKPYQDLFFTKIKYDNLLPVYYEGLKTEIILNSLSDKQILLVTGIAFPQVVFDKLSDYCDNIQSITFPDHHNFTKIDIKNIQERFYQIESTNRLIITTEKDASRLLENENIDVDLKPYIYYLPITIEFFSKENNDLFISKINKHVETFNRNNGILKK